MVEHEPIIRLALRNSLAEGARFRICAEAATVAAAYAQLVQSTPEMAVIDLELDGGGGWGLLRNLAHARLPVRCLAWLHDEDASKVVAALRAGARGVVLRREPINQLMEGLAAAAAGLRHLSNRAAQVLAEGIAHGALDGSAAVPALSERQAQVFRLLGQGFTPRQIGVKLGVGLKTVQSHIFRSRTQLGLGSQRDLCRHAAMSAA